MIEKLPKERELASSPGNVSSAERSSARNVRISLELLVSETALAPQRSLARSPGESATRLGSEFFGAAASVSVSVKRISPETGRVPCLAPCPALFSRARLRKAKEQEEVIHARHCYPTLGTLDRNRTWKPTGLSRPVAVFSRVSSPPPPLSPSLTPLILSRPSRAFVAVAEHRSTRLTRRIVRARSRL